MKIIVINDKEWLERELSIILKFMNKDFIFIKSKEINDCVYIINYIEKSNIKFIFNILKKQIIFLLYLLLIML